MKNWTDKCQMSVQNCLKCLSFIVRIKKSRYRDIDNFNFFPSIKNRTFVNIDWYFEEKGFIL